MNTSNDSPYSIEIIDNDNGMALSRHTEFVSRPGAGGLATFIGRVRDNNNGRDVDYLEYDCYPGMAKKRLTNILEEAQSEWDDRGPLKIAVSHRVGRVNIGEPAVVVAVSAPHRAEALETCRYVIDELKQRVPIWKKEHFADGEVWVDNPSDQNERENSS